MNFITSRKCWSWIRHYKECFEGCTDMNLSSNHNPSEYNTITIKFVGSDTKLKNGDKFNVYLVLDRDFSIYNDYDIYIVDTFIHDSVKFNLNEYDYSPILYHYRGKGIPKKESTKMLEILSNEIHETISRIRNETDATIQTSMKFMDTKELSKKINKLKWNNKYHKFQSAKADKNENNNIRYNDHSEDTICNICLEPTITKLQCNHYTCLECLEQCKNKLCAECRGNLKKRPKENEINKSNYKFIEYNKVNTNLAIALSCFDNEDYHYNLYNNGNFPTTHRIKSDFGVNIYQKKMFITTKKSTTFSD